MTAPRTRQPSRSAGESVSLSPRLVPGADSDLSISSLYAHADSDQLILRNSDGDSRIGDAGGTPYLAINRIYLQTEPVADYNYEY